jgi:hypothetical protein
LPPRDSPRRLISSAGSLDINKRVGATEESG